MSSTYDREPEDNDQPYGWDPGEQEERWIEEAQDRARHGRGGER